MLLNIDVKPLITELKNYYLSNCGADMLNTNYDLREAYLEGQQAIILAAFQFIGSTCFAKVLQSAEKGKEIKVLESAGWIIHLDKKQCEHPDIPFVTFNLPHNKEN